MAIIHDTTMSPGKLDLLRDWLPVQPWYLASGRAPDAAGGDAGQPCLSVTWRLADGTQVRGVFATARYLP
jgi:hypothetical protein